MATMYPHLIQFCRAVNICTYMYTYKTHKDNKMRQTILLLGRSKSLASFYPRVCKESCETVLYIILADKIGRHVEVVQYCFRHFSQFQLFFKIPDIIKYSFWLLQRFTLGSNELIQYGLQPMQLSYLNSHSTSGALVALWDIQYVHTWATNGVPIRTKLFTRVIHVRPAYTECVKFKLKIRNVNLINYQRYIGFNSSALILIKCIPFKWMTRKLYKQLDLLK